MRRAHLLGAEVSAAVQQRLQLAEAVGRREAALLNLWWGLGPEGPTLGSPSAGSKAAAMKRYLLPLARTLRGALRGSRDHLAVYLDERARYCDSTEELRRALRVELPLLAQVLAPEWEEDALEQLEQLHARLLTPALPGPRVLFVGDCLFVEIRAFVHSQFTQHHALPDIEHVFFSARQSVGDVGGSTTRAIREFRPDLIGLSLFTFDAVPLFRAAMTDNARPLRRPDLSVVPVLVSMLEAEVAIIRDVTDATVVIHAPSGIPLDRVRRRLPAPLPAHSRAQRCLLRSLRGKVAALVDATENALLLDEHDAIDGRPRMYGQPLFGRSDVPDGYFHTTKLGPVLAHRYSEVVHAVELLGGAKALFVDFDNTLWDGVMAEGEVQHNVEGQRLLKQLKEAGVLLVALSKNDPSSIRWDEMALEPEDFVLRKINWAPKPDNAAEAISELDLAPGAFVLLDDNPVERTLVTGAIPGVRSVDPNARGTWEKLRIWLELPSTKRTAEAARRTQMYREAAERRSAIAGEHDYPKMMRSLSLRSTVRLATERDSERLLELVQRTNQFNTTTRRRSSEELQRLLLDQRFGVWVATLTDRFGELGIVAVCVFDRDERMVESFIMSCRAMGFRLETAFLRTVLESETDQAPGTVRGLFLSTDRNRPASALFRESGFSEGEDGVWWLGAIADCAPVPDWLSIEYEPVRNLARNR